MVRLQIPINQRICVKCGSRTTYTNPRGAQQWGNINGECYCYSCWDKTRAPEKIKKYGPINGPKRMTFQYKRIVLPHVPRKGICQNCNKKVGDEYTNSNGKTLKIKRTHLHHLKYHNDDPLKDTMELCSSCHAYETWKQRKELS